MQTGRFALFASLLAAALLAPGAGLHAYPLNSDCHALKLVSATGVNGTGKRSYTFSGTCNIISELPAGPKVEKTVPAEASATWDPAKKELAETFRVLADFEGTGTPAHKNIYWHVKALPVSSRFACNDDPLVTNAACGLLSHENLSSFGPFSYPAQKQSRPLLKGKTSFAEAAKLSGPGAPVSGLPGFVPEPAKAPLTRVSGGGAVAALTVFEAEELLGKGGARASGGALTVQPMQGFGAGWGKDAQVFWSGGSAGAVLDFTVDVPAPGRYRVELFMTRAPDYGDLLLQVEGNNASASFTGFADTVARSDAINVGTFDLPAGPRRISLKLLGKHVQSSGYLVGIDQLRLVAQ